MSNITLHESDPSSEDGRRLIAAAGVELNLLYPEIAIRIVDPRSLHGDLTGFLIARLDGTAVGCGSVRPMTVDICELKRLYVVPEARRQGIARRILFALEQKAIDLGYKTVWLETGIRQPEAVSLYESTGYQTIKCYSPYEDDKYSLCFQKTLTSGD